MKTLYSLLGVAPTVSAEELTRAFLRLKSAYPAERLGADDNARIQFQGIEQAYKTLSSEASRQMYDARLAKVGMKTAPAGIDDLPAGNPLFGTRNLVIIGLIVVVLAGMWMFQSRERTRMEKELIEKALRIAEEEKKQQAEMREAEEARRQSNFEAQKKREEENRARQFQREAQDAVRSSQYSSRESINLQRQAESQSRQEEYARAQRERADQDAKRQAQFEAERRLANEKRLLREMCMQRYNRPDC
jgi:curved DNA-binding protein CbpA